MLDHSRRDPERIASSSTTPLTEVVYSPDAKRRQGWRIWARMFEDLLCSRELIWRLIVRDISVRYRQSVLGYVWAILPTIAAVTIFGFLTSSRTIPMSE